MNLISAAVAREPDYFVALGEGHWLLAVAGGLVLLLSAYLLGAGRARVLRRKARETEAAVTLRLEDLRRANTLKAEFIDRINHEIRNPMNGIVGVARILEARLDDPKSQVLLQTLRGCADQLRATVDDVLDFAALERESVSLVAEEFDLRELVEGACLGSCAGTDQVALKAPVASLRLKGDAGKLRLILGNYLSNALKYGVPAAAEVDVDARDEADDKVRVTVWVHNRGPALDQTEMGSLFSAFFRGRRAQETKVQGSGLGLALCRRYAEAMGGKTGVASEAGLTTFWVSVGFRHAATVGSSGGAEPSGGRVLAIEDECYNRMVLGHYLNRAGYAVEWAERGERALRMARVGNYSLVVTDWQLPDMGGAELLRRMRDSLGANMPPVVVVSAHATDRRREEALEAGVQVFLGKPLDEPRLRAVLQKLPRHRTGEEPVAAPLSRLDFSALLAVGDRAVSTREFARDLELAWGQVETLRRSRQPEALAVVHRLRAQMLLVRADEASEQLKLLEQILNERWPEEHVARLSASLAVEIRAIAAAVRAV